MSEKNNKPRITPKGGYFAISERCFVQLSNDPAYADVERDPIPAADAKRMEDGHAFEDVVSKKFAAKLQPKPLPDAVLSEASRVTNKNFQEVVESIAKKLRGRHSVWVPECDRSTQSKRSREAITVAALTAGARFVWNCRLPMRGDLISEPDFLVRTGTRRKDNGKFAYLPGDVKDAKVLEGAKAAVKFPVSILSKPSFEDAKLAKVATGSPKKKHSMQLAHYHAHLTRLGFEFSAGDVWGAIFGREGKLVWRNLSEPTVKTVDVKTGEKVTVSIIDFYTSEFADRKAVAEAAMDPEADVLASQEYKQACQSCEFRTVCHDDLVEADHITLLPGITPLRAEAHYKAGNETRSSLAALDWKTAKVIESGIDVASLIEDAANWGDPLAPVGDLVRTKSKGVLDSLSAAGVETVGDFAGLHAKTAKAYSGIKVSNLSKDIDTARVSKVQKVHLARGFSKLDIPRADIELDVDMENDTQGIIYMWGTRLKVRTSKASIPGEGFKPFVTWDSEESSEARVFAEMWAWIKALITIAEGANLTFKAYYYTPAEDRCMRHLAKKHAGVQGIPTAEEVEEFIASDYWVDLSIAVKEQLVWPTLDLSLKSVAKWARHSWRDSDASGDSSTVWHHDAVQGETEEIRAAAQQRLLDYNEDDVVATWALREWLSKLSNARDPKSRVPELSSLDSRFMRKRSTRRKARNS